MTRDEFMERVKQRYMEYGAEQEAAADKAEALFNDDIFAEVNGPNPQETPESLVDADISYWDNEE